MIYCNGGAAIKFRGKWYGPFHSVYTATNELEARGAAVMPKDPGGKHLCGYRDTDGWWCSGTVQIRPHWGLVVPAENLKLTPNHESIHV